MGRALGGGGAQDGAGVGFGAGGLGRVVGELEGDCGGEVVDVFVWRGVGGESDGWVSWVVHLDLGAGEDRGEEGNLLEGNGDGDVVGEWEYQIWGAEGG